MAEKQSAGLEALVETEAVSFFDRETGPFFRKVDWNALLAVRSTGKLEE